MTERRVYRFHPLERRGLLLGLQLGPLVTMAIGVAVALVVLRTSPGASGLLAAVGVVAATAALACWPVAGRPCIGWAPIGASWIARRRHRVSLRIHEEGIGPRGVAIVEAPRSVGEEAMGVVRDRRAGTWSATLPVSSRTFTLLDPGDKQRRLGAWGALLATSARAGSPIYRIQWIERTTAGDGDSLLAYLDEAAPPPPAQGPLAVAHRSYREVVAAAGAANGGHEVLLVVTVHPRRAGRALRSFGGGGTTAICALLRRELRLLRGQLRTADVRPGFPLDAAELAGAVRLASDPRARTRGKASVPRRPRSAWPMAIQETWSSVHIDGRWHVSYWISEWPRLDVGPDFIAPLLLAGGVRAVSLTMAPVAPDRARREVESARTADVADGELRRRAGFLSTARQRREAQGAVHRETELADGHAEYRFSGYVSVSGETQEAAETACAAVEQAAQQSHLELRRLYGQQRDAFSWTLPLGRGVT